MQAGAKEGLETCARLGMMLPLFKTEGPTTIITFLGIELGTVARMLRLPEEKLIRLKERFCGGKEGAHAQKGSYCL